MIFIRPFYRAHAIVAAEYFMLYKYSLPEITSPAATQSMPQLDFREALSTPEEKVFSPAATMAAIAPGPPAIPSFADFLHGLRFTRTTWANIVFVAIASVGGLVCAFYLFNGSELIRAAASWPREFLYPRPIFEDRMLAAEQPSPVDHFGASADEATGSQTDDGKKVADRNSLSEALAPLATNIGSTTPPVSTVPPPVTIFPPPVFPPPTSLPDNLTNRANNVATTADTFVQALLQDPTTTSSGTVAAAPDQVQKTVKKTTTVGKRKTSKAPQKVLTAVGNSSGATQQTATSQTQMSTVRPVNQMMTGGGLGGGGSITSIGGSAGSTATGTASGAAGGIGGLNAGGLGGTIGGVGGTVGGVLGGHH